MQNKTISELYTDNNKLKYSRSPKNILESEKHFYEKLNTKETTSKAATIEFLSKILNGKKTSKEKFNLCEAKISLHEIIKSINSQANNISSKTMALQRNFINTFQMNLLLSFYMFLTPGESLGPP